MAGRYRFLSRAAAPARRPIRVRPAPVRGGAGDGVSGMSGTSRYVRFPHVRPAAGRKFSPSFRPKRSERRNPAGDRGRPNAAACGVDGAPIGFLHSAPAGGRGSGRNDGKGEAVRRVMKCQFLSCRRPLASLRSAGIAGCRPRGRGHAGALPAAVVTAGIVHLMFCNAESRRRALARKCSEPHPPPTPPTPAPAPGAASRCPA